MNVSFLPRLLFLFLLSVAAALGATATSAADAKIQQKFDQANQKAAEGLHAEAIELFNQILTERPDSDNVLAHRAAVRAELGQMSAASADLAQALRINPKNASAFRVRAEIKLQAGDPAGALPDLDKAVELAPNVATARALRGHVRYLLKRFDEALADVERALELAPGFYSAILLRGDIQQAKGNLSLGFADYSRVIQAEPENSAGFLHRAWRRFETLDFDRAIADANRAISLSKGKEASEAGRLLGYSHFAKRDDRAAIAALGDAARGPSADQNVYALLIRHLAMRRAGTPDDARLAAAAELAAEKSWARTLADFLLGKIEEDDLDGIATKTEKPSERAGRVCEMHFYVGMVRLISGDKSTARLRLRSAVATHESTFFEYTLAQKFLTELGAAEPSTVPARDGVEPRLLQQAEDGDKEAQWQIAETYRRRLAESKDAGKMAKEWWTRAAASGSEQAKVALAAALIEGTDGFSKDEVRGTRMLETAADAGHPEAMWRWGERYVFGPKNFRRDDRAVHYLKGAVDKGETRAQAAYAYLLFLGRGVAADPQAAVQLLNAAEKRGDVNARRFLLTLWSSGQIQLKAAAQLERVLGYGVEVGDPTATGALGARRYRGEGGRRDEAAGLGLLHRASDAGDAESARILSEHYTTRLAQLPKSDHQTQAYEDALDDLRRAWFELGRNGTREEKVKAARLITDFADPATPAMKERISPTIASDVAGAIALLRMYRKDGGKDDVALAWLDKMERSLATAREPRNRSLALKEVEEIETESRQIIGRRDARLRDL